MLSRGTRSGPACRRRSTSRSTSTLTSTFISMVSRSNRPWLIALLAWLVAAFAPLAAQTPAPATVRLSFADAVRLASGEVPVVALATLRTTEADARVRQARAALLPSASVGGFWLNRTFNSRSIGISFPGVPELIGPFNNYDARVSASQALFDWSSVKHVRAAGAQADGSRAERGVTVEASVLTTAIAYVRAVRAQAVVGARQADSAIAAELVGLAEAQRAAGVSPAIDVTRPLGLDPATPLSFSDSLAPSLGAADVSVQRDSAVSAALANRPELRAELARAAAARQTGSAIRAERLPRIELAGDYGVNGPTAPRSIATRDITLQVSVPILDGFRREARLDEQDAVVRESQVREADLRRQIAAEVDAAVLDLGSAEAQQLVAREELRLAESELSQARERFKAGVAGNIDVITAQVGLVRARDTEIDARFAAATARVSLARAAGVAKTLH